MTIPSTLALVVLLAASLPALLLAPVAARAQNAGAVSATPFLPADHWSIEAARRLADLGLLEAGYDRGTRSRTRGRVGRELQAAAVRAASLAPDLADLAWSYVERYGEEFPEQTAARSAAVVESGESSGVRLTALNAELTAGAVSGYMATGWLDKELDVWVPPSPRAVRPGEATVSMSARAGEWLSARVAGGWTDGGWGVREAEVTTGYRALGVWAGKRTVAWGPGLGGGMVLEGREAFTGVGVFVRDGIRLPGWFGRLGRIEVETFLSRVEQNGAFAEPWFWGARGSLVPHPRFGLGVTRGAMFGGEGNVPFEVRDLVYVIIGKHGAGGSRFDNQIAAFDLWWRPPIARGLVLYLELGMEDSAGAWRDVPGFLTGIRWAAVPGASGLSVALERASFAQSCCGNPAWYRHWSFSEGWTVDLEPLAHPLGGHGKEWLLDAALDLAGARLRVESRIFWRDRGAENLYAPVRVGESIGGGVSVSYRPDRRWEGEVELGGEVGDEWQAGRALIGARLFVD